MDQGTVTKRGKGRPRRVGDKLPTMSIRLTDGSRYHLEAVAKLFPGAKQSSLLRTAWDLAVQHPGELEEEIRIGYEDRGQLGKFRSRLGLSTLSTSFPLAKGVASFRMEAEQHAQYKSLIGTRSPMLVFEAALRLFHKKAEEH